ncbi:MAG: discoidin domain-containing protein, partial [bacterium]
NTRPSKILQIEQKSTPWEVVATDSADGKTVYVHVMIPPAGQTLHLPPLNDSRKLLAASLLLGGNIVKFKQSEESLELSLPAEVKWDLVDTVIVLKVGPAFEPGVLLSEHAKLELSSTCGHDNPTNHARLFSGDKVPFAFHTDTEKNPWAKIDLGAVRIVRTVEIENRQGEEERTKGLIMSISEDGQKWEEVWQAKSWVATWIARVTQFSGGSVKAGRKARFIKLETRGDSIRPLVLKRVTVFGIM